jgi:ketosteroid isomerase-like protein
MSQENVETIRRSFGAFDRRDRSAWLEFRYQDLEVVPVGAWPEADVIRGREAAWDFYVEAAAAFEPRAYGDAEILEAGSDKVLVHQRNKMRGRASGVDVELNYWVVVTFRAGKILREEWFANRAEALEAAGLRG